MKLILVNPNPLPSPDPESLQFLQTAVALAKNNIDVYFIVSKGLSESVETYYNLQIPRNLHLYLLPCFKIQYAKMRISSNLPFFFLSLFKMLDIIKKQKINAIVVRNLKLGYFLLGWGHILNLPSLFFETHEIFTMSFREEMSRKGIKSHKKEYKIEKMERFVYKTANGIICITGQLSRIIKEQFAIKGPVLIAPDGVNLEFFHGNKELLCHKRDSRGIKTILYIGSLHHWKGIDVLLKTMQYLNNDVKLLIVGGNSEVIRRYQILADELNISNRVHFEGFVSPSCRFNYFSKADICVLPLKPVNIASYCTSPLKLFEYMASKKPIIASDLPAIREILFHNTNSILVPPDDPKALADGIRCLLENPALREKLGEQAATDVHEYTWDKRAEKIISFIQSCGGSRCAE